MSGPTAGIDPGLARKLGPTTARNWGWAGALGLVAALFASVAIGVGTMVGSAALVALWGAAGLSALGALRVWHLPPLEQVALEVGPNGLVVVGRRRRASFDWSDIAALSYRPSSLGPPHLSLERRAEAGKTADPGPLGDAPGVLIPVRAVGARVEDIVAFIARGAAEAGYRLDEPLAGDGRARHRFPGPRYWVVVPARARDAEREGVSR